MTVSSHSAWAEIDLSALAHNLDAVWTGQPRRFVIAVVKADAYGHGAERIAKVLVEKGVTMLAVATVAEGAALRAAGIEAPLLLMGAHTAADCPDIISYNLVASVSSVDFAAALDAAACERGAVTPVHIKIDTGMSRLGIPAARAVSSVERISIFPNLALEGIFTHFATSDLPEDEFTLHQVEEFNRVIATLAGMGVKFKYQHAAASAACMAVPESHYNTLRPGLALYGLHPAPCCAPRLELKPVMEFAARVVHVETHPAGSTVGYGRTHTLAVDSRLAVISAGYADGYDRRFSDKAVVTIRGKAAPVIGRVSMDLTSVDVTAIPDVRPGDKAVLFSRDPKAPNSVENLACLIDTIPYTLTCGVSKRVTRIYKE